MAIKTYTLERQQIVRRPLDEVFLFFSKPENLGSLTPVHLGFQILTPSPVGMREGTVIDYAIRVSGMPVRWTTLITLYEPPYRFTDLQIRGPYAYWHHTHTFAETDDGTTVTDRVVYAMPFRIFGSILHAVFVRSSLRAIFEYRSRAIEKIFSVPDSVQEQV